MGASPLDGRARASLLCGACTPQLLCVVSLPYHDTRLPLSLFQRTPLTPYSFPCPGPGLNRDAAELAPGLSAPANAPPPLF